MGTPGAVYRPRDAAASPLYRVVLNHIESFAQERRADSPAGEISGLLAETLTDFLRRRSGSPEGAAPAQSA